MKIPTLMHFIWAGGNRYLPPPNIDVIKSWIKANPDFTFLIWLDSASSVGHQDEINHYSKVFKDSIDSSNLQFKDITHYKNNAGISFSNEFVRYEIDRLRPNYGASSDILRYMILYQFGGAYFDSDVEPNPDFPLSQSGIFEAEYSTHTLFVDENSQNSKKLGNDSFITTQFNPIFQKIFATALEHYSLNLKNLNPNSPNYRSDMYLAERNSIPVLPFEYDKAKYIIDVTPFKTGPYCVRKVCENPETVERYTFEECGSDIQPLTNHRVSLPNDQSWTNKSIQRMPYEEALSAVKKTIDFEQHKLAILRLDDHISNLIESSRCEPSQAIEDILQHIKTLELDTIDCIQLSFAYSETFEFCKANSLVPKTFLFPLEKHCLNTTDHHYYFELPIERLANIEAFDALILKANSDLDQDRIEAYSAYCAQQTTPYILFSHEAVSFCQNILDKMLSSNRESHKEIIGSYLKAILNGFDSISASISNYKNNTNRHLFEEINKKISEAVQSIKNFVQNYGLTINDKPKQAIAHEIGLHRISSDEKQKDITSGDNSSRRLGI